MQLMQQTASYRSRPLGILNPPLLLELTVSPCGGAVGDEGNRREEAWASYGGSSASVTTIGIAVTDVHPPRAEKGLTTSLTGGMVGPPRPWGRYGPNTFLGTPHCCGSARARTPTRKGGGSQAGAQKGNQEWETKSWRHARGHSAMTREGTPAPLCFSSCVPGATEQCARAPRIMS